LDDPRASINKRIIFCTLNLPQYTVNSGNETMKTILVLLLALFALSLADSKLHRALIDPVQKKKNKSKEQPTKKLIMSSLIEPTTPQEVIEGIFADHAANPPDMTMAEVEEILEALGIVEHDHDHDHDHEHEHDRKRDEGEGTYTTMSVEEILGIYNISQGMLGKSDFEMITPAIVHQYVEKKHNSEAER